jgi:subtilisin family serine protease
MNPLQLVKLTALMERTGGSPEVKIGLIDGPIAENPALSWEHLNEVPGSNNASCNQTHSIACFHGTFVAGILFARRNSAVPGICPNCTLLVRPIFSEATYGGERIPSAAPQELAAAIIECIDIGARVINLSLALGHPSTMGDRALEEALYQALRRNVIVVAAAGNQRTLGSSAITRHPWVISVVACDLQGRPMNGSTLGSSIGRRGLRAPGDGIISLGAEGQTLMLAGTSIAAPFVTGTIALLWSEFPTATAGQIKLAVTQSSLPRRAAVVPPLLDAAAAYQSLSATIARR